MPIKTPYNYVYSKDICCEHNKGQSETIPDQSYSIQELLIRFTTGTTPNIIKQVSYDEGLSDNDTDADFERDDPTESGDFDLVDAFTAQRNMELDKAEREAYARAMEASKKKVEPEKTEVSNEE